MRSLPSLRVVLLVVAVMLVCPGCSAVRPDDSRVLLDLTQKYLNDQVNSVTDNERNNRFLGTNELPADRIVDPLAGVLRREAPRIKLRRDKSRGQPNDHDWAKAEMVSPVVTVTDDRATMRVTESTEMHYRFSEPSNFYSIDHKFAYVRIDGVWKISDDQVGSPDDEDEPLPYARRNN